MAYFSRKSSGLFVPYGNGFKEVKDAPSMSINETILFFNYNLDEIYTHIGQGGSNAKIYTIAFEVFTRTIVFVMTDRSVTFLTEKDVKKHLGDFSFAKIFDSLKVKDILDAGIENESLKINFLSKVLKLDNVSSNGMFYSDKIKTYLYITDGLLTNYQYDDGFFPTAKHLKQANRTVYDFIANAALKYRHDNTFLAQKEINIQTEAWSAIPGAFGNPFIKFHRYETNFANLHMLRVVHYGYPITRQQFEELNHGRYFRVNNVEHDNNITYRCGQFDYTFLDSGELLKFEEAI